MWGLMGPTKAVTAGHVEISFQVFYKTLFKSLSALKAIKALNETVTRNEYLITSVEQFFYAVWRSYKKDMCSEEMIKKRATSMHQKAIYNKALSNNLVNIPSIEQFRQLICNRKEERYLFEKYRDTFFMIDLYPTHRNRFPVTYEEAEKYVAKN